MNILTIDESSAANFCAVLKCIAEFVTGETPIRFTITMNAAQVMVESESIALVRYVANEVMRFGIVAEIYTT